jgi:Dolichyl-phosphate-mannose-protein mannosyltransferase
LLFGRLDFFTAARNDEDGVLGDSAGYSQGIMGEGTASTPSIGIRSKARVRKASESCDRPTPTYFLVSVNLLWISAAILAAGVVLRVWGIETQSLWTDDGFSLEYSTCDGLAACFQHMTSADTSEQFNILYFLVLHLWRDTFGDSTLSLRALSVSASILSLPLIWCTAAALFGRSSATWSLALSATSAFALFYAHEVRPYAFLVLISALQLWLLARARAEGASAYSKILFIGVALIASWASIFSLLFTIAIGVGDLLARRQWVDGLKWWMPIAVVSIPAVLYYVVQALDAPPGSVLTTKSDAFHLNFLFVIYGHLVGQTYSVPLLELHIAERWSMLAHHWVELTLFGITCALLMWQFVNGLRSGGWTERRRYGMRMIIYSTAIFLGLCLTFAVATEQNWLPRHAFALHVLLALLLPAAASSPDADRHTRSLRLTALSCLIILNLWSINNYYYDPAHWRDDYRGVASYLKQQHAEGRPAVMLHGKVAILRHYGDDNTVDGHSFHRSTMPSQIFAATENAREVLVVVNREFALESEDGYVREWEPRGLIVSIMSPKYHLVDKEIFHFFTIYRFALHQ